MNKSILIAGALIAGAILLQPIVARLVEKQTTTICTETGMRQVSGERDAQQENPPHKGFGAEPPRGKGKLYDLNAPNESDMQTQNMSEREIDRANKAKQRNDM